MAVSLSINIKQNSQNTTANKSNITVNVVASWTYGSFNRNSQSGFVIIDETQYDFTASFNDNQTTSGSKTLYTKTLDIAHKSDGSKTVSCSAEYITGVSSGTITATASKALTRIPIKATIVSAPNFNDEANPTITYKNSAGNSVDKLRACISLTGASADIAYRDISKTGTSYTFNLTDAERKVLRAATTTSNSRTVRFYIETTIGDNVYRVYSSKTFSIVNANPTLSPTVEDTNSTTLALTGDKNKIVKYYSNAKVSIGAAAIKEATLTSQKATNGSKSITAASGTMNAVESGKFVFTATDSRGNTTTKTVDKTLVNYVKLTCNIATNTPDVDGNYTFTVSGNYFNGSFGTTANTLAVYYRYKTAGGSYSSWATMTVSKSGNTYTATKDITGLDYQTNYIFQAYAQDKLAKVETSEKPIKALPIFDWDADSFAFHVPVFMDNTKQIWYKDTSGTDMLMISVNASNQAFFGYGAYNAGIGTTYFDGNVVNIRSKGNITNTASGTIGGNKAWTNSSDRRLKEDIVDLPEVFSAIWYELQPKMFRWNELNNGDNSYHFGLIAQDVIEVFSKYGLDWRNYGFIATIPVGETDYYAITYEYYNILTAKVLKNTIEELNDIKKELAAIKAAMASQGVI